MAAKKNFTTGTASFFTPASTADANDASDAKNITDALNTSCIADANDADDTACIADANDAKKVAANGRYNFNLKMPLAWKQRIADLAWQKRMSISDMLNLAIGEWLDSQEGKKP